MATVEKREREPNDSPATANVLRLDTEVQGETKYYSADVHDEDWFAITLLERRTYWFNLYFADSGDLLAADTTGDSKIEPLLHIFRQTDLTRSLGGRVMARTDHFQKENKVVGALSQPVEGPGDYYVRICSERTDLAYNVEITTEQPEWAARIEK